MSNDEKKPYKRVSSDEQAYDDLLSFYSSDTKPHRPSERSSTQSAKSPASRPASNNAKGFKLDIKDIDSEFNQPVRRAPVKREQSAHTQIYKKPEPAAKRPTQRNSEKPVNKSADEYGKIDLMPAFEDDRRYIPKREAVKPEYKSEPQRQAAPERKKPVQKKASPFSCKKKKPQGDVPYKKPEIVHDENGRAVIVKKNEIPPKKKIELFFKQNKKAWVLIAVCIAAAALISTYAISCMNDILAIGRDSETVVTVNIPAQTDTKGAIDILKENKLIKHKYFCRICAKALEYRDDNYLTGIYYLTESMGLENMLSSFKKPTVTGETVTLTFPGAIRSIRLPKSLKNTRFAHRPHSLRRSETLTSAPSIRLSLKLITRISVIRCLRATFTPIPMSFISAKMLQALSVSSLITLRISGLTNIRHRLIKSV